MATYAGAEYQLLTTTMAGVPYAEIADAAIESITWELNGWGEAIFSMPVTATQAWDELQPDYQTVREVQIWRNGVLIWWGIYLFGDADQDRVTFTAYGLLWYFTRRYFGPVVTNIQGNLLTNGDMEGTPLTAAWTGFGPVAISAATTRRRKGAQSMKIVSSGIAGQECGVYAGHTVPTPARIKPLLYTISGWHYIEAVTIHHYTQNAIGVGPGGSSAADLTRIAPTDRLGEWIFRQHQFEAPAGYTTPNLTAVLYAASAGTVYWDDVRLSYQQRTGAIEGEDWADDYLRRIFNYGAGVTGGGSEGPGGSVGDQKSWWGDPNLKQSLNMTYAGAASAAGALRADTFWDHADGAVIWQAMAEIPVRDLLDFEITWAANGRSRTLTAYAPRKGSTKLGLAIEDGGDLVGWRYTVDGRRRCNDMRARGRTSGAVPEEGHSAGTAFFFPPQLESVISPAFELGGQALIDQATKEKGRLVVPVKVATVTVKAGRFMGDIQPGGTAEAGAPLVVGDTVPVRITHGWVREAANRRVVKMTLRPATETLDIVFND